MNIAQPHHPTTDMTPIQLTGDWQVCSVPLNDDTITLTTDCRSVPQCAHLQTVLYPDRPYWGDHLRQINKSAWLYQRQFTLPDIAYKRVRLRFEAVDYFASVYVNGQHVGDHEGNFAPFILDITPFICPHESNTLTVRVTSPWDTPNEKGSYPIDHVIRGLVKGLYEHGEGVIPPDVNPIGIWRPVYLLLDDGLSIDHVIIRTQLDGQVDLKLTVTNATDVTVDGLLNLAITADNHTGAGVSQQIPVHLKPGTQVIEQRLTVPDPHLWWSWDHGSPDLYRLDCQLSDQSGALLSSHNETFGIRTVRLERSPERFTFYLNERPIYLRGSSYIPALYLSTCTPEKLERDVQLARDANLNLLRVHVHVSPREVYDLCDRHGLLIWQDSELNWIQDYSLEFEQRAIAIQRDMINLLGNHPSVIAWVCHNEPTMIFTRRQNLELHPDPALYADALQQDPTRPVFICSGQIEDDWQRAGDVHSYYGSIWTSRYTDIAKYTFRLNTEFGFEAPAALTTLQEYPDLWERLKHLDGEIDALGAYQAELIQYQVEYLRRLRATCCTGFIHFWLADMVPQVGCGVLDSNRIPKGGYAALKQASQPLMLSLEHDGRQPSAIWVLNDTMQTYSDARIRWTVRDASGKALLEGQQTFDVSANAAQKVCTTIWNIPASQCARVELTLISASGETLSETVYAHPFQPTPRPKDYPWKFDPYLGTKVFNRPDAPSLADYNINNFLKYMPLSMRENLAEWGMRQKLPIGFASFIAQISEYLL
jgi:beta-mannosidase